MELSGTPLQGGSFYDIVFKRALHMVQCADILLITYIQPLPVPITPGWPSGARYMADNQMEVES